MQKGSTKALENLCGVDSLVNIFKDLFTLAFVQFIFSAISVTLG